MKITSPKDLEEFERLEQIEQAAKALFNILYKALDFYRLDEELEYIINLGTALYGEDDPRVKELTDGS